ncbi:serine hydrolase domain-containing protein [Sphingomonas colocasiae]|uniref:Beta-lactamase family protein n=1 Tax=Sphingomonas colocasiae TaxID=1848973 RepID=A0ABS7Q1T3_9SPHN|nr:serine hydrolase domain-containing protein [Sphingomonas colocasiae]MBY8826184.1 beta-lactamase family protein [Sphingomonas colocasiae]
MLKQWLGGLAVAAAAGTLVAQVPDNKQRTPAELQSPPAATPAVPDTSAFNKTDVDAWLDGFMPYALQRGDIAGAVVLVVKDGQVLTQKGYGYADLKSKRKVDPETTLFRPGSMSKLFTWTSIMQLVEQGKLDLDADVNTYLDFKIPPYDGKPITLRMMMSHVAGFEEASGGLIVPSPATYPPLGDKLKEWIPARIFPPGTTPAYSNYATGLAGYVVARVSGQPFDEYLESHIFGPLGMQHTTMRQPLPANLKPLMATGYDKASGAAKPFEIVTLPPAGSGSASAPDIARFMIAHMNDGQGLMRPETARQMHNSPLHVFPGVPSMSLGFIEVLNHGRRIISHGGDTAWFHTGMWMIPEAKSGLYVSMNSAGRDGATGAIREALLAEFMRRYFPAPAPKDPPLDKARAIADGQAMAGTYVASRRYDSGLRKALTFFSQQVVSTDKDGSLKAPNWLNVGGGPDQWVHIGPFLWRNAETSEVMSAKAENGRVTIIAQSFPASVAMRVPWYENTSWLRPAIIASLVVLLLAALAWPLGWVQRRYYAAQRATATGRTLGIQRSVAGLSAASLVTIGIWFNFLTTMRGQPMGGGVYALQAATVILLPGLAGFALARLWQSWKGGSKLSIGWSALVALAALIVLWGALAFHLIHIGIEQ